MTNMDNNKDDSEHLEKISDFKTYAKVQNINNYYVFYFYILLIAGLDELGIFVCLSQPTKTRHSTESEISHLAPDILLGSPGDCRHSANGGTHGCVKEQT